MSTDLEIDKELLVAVHELLAALLEVLRVKARREEVEALSTMQGMDLSDSKVLSEAWPI
jgi:hypothetical protein